MAVKCIERAALRRPLMGLVRIFFFFRIAAMSYNAAIRVPQGFTFGVNLLCHAGIMRPDWFYTGMAFP
jgi:hypothetical protein